MVFLIYCNEDGYHVSCFEKKDVHEALSGHGLLNWTPFSSPPKERDPAYWGEQYLLIEGNIVVPKAITTVTKMVIP